GDPGGLLAPRSRSGVGSAGVASPRDASAQRRAQAAAGEAPRRDGEVGGRGGRLLLAERLGEHGDERGELLLGGMPAQHLDLQGLLCLFRGGHSGMFPCFLGGSSARLPRRARNAFAIDTRVLAGSMMPSISPRSAARNGEV